MFASPGQGKTYKLFQDIDKQIFVSFLPYDRFGEHFERFLSDGKTVEIIVVDELKVFEFPKRNMIFLDCTNYTTETEFHQYLIDIMDKNKKNYSTLTIDEAHTTLPSGVRPNPKKYPLLDHVTKSRNHGYRIILASQRVKALQAQARSMCRAVLLGKISPMDDLSMKAVEDILSKNGVSNYTEINRNLEKYEFKEFVFA